MVGMLDDVDDVPDAVVARRGRRHRAARRGRASELGGARVPAAPSIGDRRARRRGSTSRPSSGSTALRSRPRSERLAALGARRRRGRARGGARRVLLRRPRLGARVGTRARRLRADALLFGESQSRMLCRSGAGACSRLRDLARREDVPLTILGEVRGQSLVIDGRVNGSGRTARGRAGAGRCERRHGAAEARPSRYRRCGRFGWHRRSEHDRQVPRGVRRGRRVRARRGGRPRLPRPLRPPAPRPGERPASSPSNGEALQRHRGMGLVADIFDRGHPRAACRAACAIGHDRYSTARLERCSRTPAVRVRVRRRARSRSRTTATW